MFAMLRSLLGVESAGSAELDYARSLSWRQFEYVVREGFRRRGYTPADHVGMERVDVMVRKDGDSFLVQCKQWKSTKIGIKPLRELASLMTAHEAAGGFYITVGSYTDEARQFAKNASIELIDGPALRQLVVDARRPEPFLDPTESRRRTSFRKAGDDPLCPMCGGAMVKRAIARGSQSKEFWGCLQAPDCRGMRELK